MKRLFIILFISCTIFTVFVNCDNNDNYIPSETSKENLFRRDFEEFLHAQYNTIHSFNTRADDISEDDLYRIASILDSLHIDFYTRNIDYILSLTDTISLSQEEIDIMIIDEDAFMSFLTANFSPEFCHICEDYINEAGCTRSNETAFSANLSEIENIICEEMECTKDYKDMLFNLTETKIPVPKTEKEKLCMKDLNNTVDQCNKIAARSFILTIITPSVKNKKIRSLSELLDAISLLNTAHELNICTYRAKENYKKCIENKQP